MLSSWYTASLIKRMCMKLSRYTTAARDRVKICHGIKKWQEHAAHSMSILKSKKEELHFFFPLLANTKSQHALFVAYDCPDWITTERACKISPVRRVEPRITPWIHIGCESRSLRGGWSILHAFTSILARWTRLTRDQLRVHARQLVGRGFHCTPYLAHILY